MKRLKGLLFTILLTAVYGSGKTEEQQIHEELALYINGTTSSFIKIVKTDDIRIKDPNFVTPALMLVAKRNGDIVRCLQHNPRACEIFYRTNSEIYTMLVYGEYIYVGFSSGDLMKCDLDKINGTCSLLHKFNDAVSSLLSTRGYLHVGLDNKTIVRCDFQRPNDCQVLHALDSSVNSLIELEDHLYAGLWDGRLMRCSMRTTNSCVVVDNMTGLTGGVMGLEVLNNNLIALTWDGSMYNCSLKKHLADNFCVRTSIGMSNMWDIAVSNGVLYYANNDEGVYSCKWEESQEALLCTPHGDHAKARGIAFVYSTYQMQGRYKTEESTCAWQSRAKCPPFVTYYEPRNRAMLEVHVKDGKLWNSVGDLVDTRGADEGKKSVSAGIFVMGPDGRLLLSNAHVELLLHTSSLLAGGPIAGAGELIVEDGIITSMTTCSDHYRPTLELNRQVVEALRWQGYTRPIDLQEC